MYNKVFNKDYVLLLQGSLFSLIGSLLYSAAIGYWVYATTGSTGLMGIVSSVTMIMRMILSPFGGSIADYFNKRNILVICDLVCGASFLFVGFLALNNLLSITYIIMAAIISGICSSFFAPASTTLVVDILNEKILIKGQSIMNGSSAVVQLVGSSVSGVIIVYLGVPLLIFINGISYIISAISEMFIKSYPSHNNNLDVNVKTVLRNLIDGVKYTMTNKGIRVLFIAAIFMNLTTSGFFSVAVAYVLENGMDMIQYGYFSGALSLGGLLGVIFLSIFNIRNNKRFLWMVSCFIISNAALAIGIYLADFYITCVLMLVGMLFNGIANGILNAVMIIALPEAKRGVLTGCLSSFAIGGSALSAILYGLIGELAPLKILGAIGILVSYVPLVWLALCKDTKRLFD